MKVGNNTRRSWQETKKDVGAGRRSAAGLASVGENSWRRLTSDHTLLLLLSDNGVVVMLSDERPWVGLESFVVLPKALAPLHFQKKSQNRSVCRLSFSSCLVEKMFFTMFCILSGFNNNLFPDSFLSPNFAGWPVLQWPHLVDNNNENHLY